MSLGSALLLILVVALVRWYGGSSGDTTATQSTAADRAAQATPLPATADSATGAEGTAEALASAVATSNNEDAATEVELAVATLPPVELDTPAPTEAATAAVVTAPEDTATAAPTRAPPTNTPKSTATSKPTATLEPTATPRPRPTATATAVHSVSGLPLVYFDELPPEAQETIALIDSNGPFPYYKDGVTFQNRERILPRRSNGYYREYTVITPGSDDRGARRIVAGADGELYYTDDHYDSFREVVR